MEIIINAEAKEIAALVEELKGRRDISHDEFNGMLEAALAQAVPGVILPEH